MSELQELRQKIENYRQLLGEVQQPRRSDHDELAERLLSRLLHEATHRLKALEQGTVKLHTPAGVLPGPGRSPWRGRGGGEFPSSGAKVPVTKQ